MTKPAVNLVILLVCLFVPNGQSICENKEALNNITVNVHETRISQGANYIQTSIYRFDRYEIIHVHQGNITDLCEGMIKNFPNLRSLNLINVNLSKMEPDAFQLTPKLIELSLAINKLTELQPGVFNNLESLEKLYLSGNNIKSVRPGAFAKLKHLKHLHLDNNNLSHLDRNILVDASSLRLLDLRFNYFTTIDEGSFARLAPSHDDAVTILLARNEIADVDSNALGFKNRVNLHLERNKMSAVSDLLHAVSDYSNLYLDHNDFSCLPDDVLENLKSTTKKIYLMSNPLVCQCLERIESFLGAQDPAVGNGSLTYCSSCPCDWPTKAT